MSSTGGFSQLQSAMASRAHSRETRASEAGVNGELETHGEVASTTAGSDDAMLKVSSSGISPGSSARAPSSELGELPAQVRGGIPLKPLRPRPEMALRQARRRHRHARPRLQARLEGN
jgi:hypothetical protein